ncbi:MAG: sigma-70 family RNA polymerase sigma factor [Bacteroidota bacterium]
MDHTDQSDISPSLWDGLLAQQDKLLGFIRKRVSSWEDAEDVMQDVYYQLADRLEDESNDVIDNVGAWVFAVARNKISDLFRKKKPSLLNEDREDWLWGLLSEEDDAPEQKLYRKWMWKALEDALLEIPSEQSEVFVWHEMDRMSFNEISEMTGVGVNTLISRKRYAVLHLRERLRDLYEEWND